MMKAIRLNSYGFPAGVAVENIEKPRPGFDEVLVHVRAAAVNPVDWMIAEGYGKEWWGHSLPMTLGCDLAGVIESVGERVGEFKSGDSVFGYSNLMRLGAFAEFAVVGSDEIAPMPASLDFVHAAAVPVSTLTPWQAMFVIAGLQSGQSVLVHAAAGGVGSMAVQLAKARGARVIGTASGRNVEFVRSLGADEVIDYMTTRFEDAVHDVDVVFDLVGGETQSRSIGVLRKGGFLVSAVQPPDEAALADTGRRGGMVKVEPNGSLLREIAALIDSGKVVVNIERVLPLDDAVQALELSKTGRTRGKIVLEM